MKKILSNYFKYLFKKEGWLISIIDDQVVFTNIVNRKWFFKHAIRLIRLKFKLKTIKWPDVRIYYTTKSTKVIRIYEMLYSEDPIVRDMIQEYIKDDSLLKKML